MSAKSTPVTLREHLELGVMALLALGQYALVESGVRSPLSLGISILINATLLFGGIVYFRRVQAQCEDQPVLLPVIIVIGILSLALEPVFRLLPIGGSALEVVLVRGLKNEMLLFAMACCWRQWHPLTVVSSLFLFLFSMALSPSGPLTRLFLGLYLCATTYWLIARYLRRYAGTLHASHHQYSLKRFLVLALIPLAVIIVLGPFASGRTIWSLQGFFATSGGEGGRDQYAMGGIGNGDALVPGKENVQTFAPIDDAPFREDHKPSLYDSFSEEYGDAFKPKEQDRMIALPPQKSKDMLPELAREMKTMQQSGRQFSTLRNKTGRMRADIDDMNSKALFHVVGRVPLHLRMDIYDFYDGVELIPGEPTDDQIKYKLVEHDQFHWLEASENTVYDFFSAEESHVLKIVGIDTNIIPTPLHWTGIAIKDLEMRNFYKEGQYRVIHLDRDALPELIPIHIRSRVLDERHFDSAQVLYSGRQIRYLSVPDSPDMVKIKELSRQITRGHRRQRDQVEAIERYMRERYRHLDKLPEGIPDELSPGELSVSRFLFERKGGTDYEFATATMLLLRSLDISCRVVSGFYADPENYDRRKDHTSVFQEDVHFWCEVYLGGNIWNTLEPTPGYEKLAPPLSLYEKIEFALLMVVGWIAANWIGFLLTVLLASLLVWQRRPVLALLCWVDWKLRCAWLRLVPEHAERSLLFTRVLVDRFLRLSGHSRPAGVPLRKWITDSYQLSEKERQQLTEFLRSLDAAVYGTRTVDQNAISPSFFPDPLRLSSDTIRHFSWSRFRRV
ncbi:MAG: hypothetical protein CMJ46_05605 [Planctomyces sp.]|nr:hypothetical protein [Planctomyces sp.]